MEGTSMSPVTSCPPVIATAELYRTLNVTSTSAATLARIASVPEWLSVPSPRFWMRCGSATKGERPIHGTPSAPIGVGARLCMPRWRASKYMIP